MGLSCNICYAVIIFFIASVSFFDDAQFPRPMAMLSTSWINKPSIYIELTDFVGLSLTPVLEGSSKGSHLICGFYCPTQQTQACLFGVVLFASTDYFSDNSSYIIAAELVWSANRDNPVQIDATLQLTGDGDLILHDAAGTFVWSTNTSGKSVFSMNFTELGNLVLFDQNNKTVWQSFDHPTDSLLVGQTLFRGQKLTSSKSTANLTPGLFSFKVQDYYEMVVAYVESNPPLPNFKSYVGVKYVKFEKESFLGEKIPVASSSSPQFIRLDPDGHLKAYEWDGQNWNWNVMADLMTSDIGDCGYPIVCGNYGICSSNGQCACPDDANSETSTFRQISYRQPNLGCSLATPISCDHSQYHTLLELNNTSYFYINPYAYTSTNFYLDEKLALNDCKTSCLKNCSCKAALFLNRMGFNDSRQGCLLLSEVFSLINNEGGVDYTIVFLIVHKCPATQYLNPSSPIDFLQKKSMHVEIILGASLRTFFGVFFVVASCFFLFKKKQESGDFDEFSVNHVPWTSTKDSYGELRAMTNNFNDTTKKSTFCDRYKPLQIIKK